MTPKSKIKATKAWAWVWNDGTVCLHSMFIFKSNMKAWVSNNIPHSDKGSIQRVLITAAKAKGGR